MPALSSQNKVRTGADARSRVSKSRPGPASGFWRTATAGLLLLWGGLGDGFFAAVGLSWVVAGAGADGHFAVMGGVGFDVDGAITAE